MTAGDARSPLASVAGAPSGLAGYAARHWSGRLPLAVSFWVNLVLVRALLLGAQGAVTGGEGGLRGQPVLPVALALLAMHGALFVWQAVGTLRAAEVHAHDTGSPLGRLGAVLGVLVAFWLTVASALEGYQTTLPPAPAESASEGLRRERAASYTLERIDGGTALRLAGPVVPGVTARVRAALEAGPDIAGIVLGGPGGNVYEARGLARLFRERELWTRVEGDCASACAVAFVGGARRTLGPGGRLGLHGYRMDGVHAPIVTDVASEQRRDAALYARAGVAPDFVARMFDAGADGMWWPEPEELLRAGVVHALPVVVPAAVSR